MSGALRQLGAARRLDCAPAAIRSCRLARLRCTLKRSGEALGQQVLRHAVAHHAEADETDGLVHEVVFANEVAWAAASGVPALASHHRKIRRR